jgi:hypothetical protein
MDIWGESRACGGVTGEFIVNDLAFANGNVSRLDIAFVQHCTGTREALFGEVSVNEPVSSGLTIRAPSILFPPEYVGVAPSPVPLWLSNPTAVDVTLGAITLGGLAAGDVTITADTCPVVLAAGAACTVTVEVTPTAAGLRHASVTVGSSTGPASVAITDPGIPGNAAFVLDSPPGEAIGGGQQLTANQFNSGLSGIIAYGTPSSVEVDFTTGTSFFHAVFAAPAGQHVGVGTYTGVQAPTTQPSSSPGLDVDSGQKCTSVVGQFTVLDISFDPGGDLASFAADAQQSCGGGPTLYASVRWASPVPYTAVGVEPDPQRLIFDGRLTGSPSPPQTVTVANTGVVPLLLSSSVAGPNAGDYLVVSSCAAIPVAPGAACTFEVTFDPLAVGASAATLVIHDNTPRGQRSVPLSGTGTPPPAFLYPAAGQSNADTNLLFGWSTSPQVQAYQLSIGTAAGRSDLVKSPILPATQPSYAVPALPAGTTLYATLSSEVGGNWGRYQTTISFRAVAHVAAFTNPLPSDLGANPAKPFTWTTNSQAGGYYLVVGTSPGSANLLNSGVLAGSVGSYPAPPMPATRPLYATLFTEWAGHWDFYQSIVFAVQNGAAAFNSPLNGQHVTDASAPYTWSTFADAEAYYFVLSTSRGGANLVNSGILPPTRSYYPGIPLPKGVPIYATIFTKIQGSWNNYQTITFTAG